MAKSFSSLYRSKGGEEVSRAIGSVRNPGPCSCFTMAMYLQTFLGEAFSDFGMLAAVGVFHVLPVVVLFLLGQRFLLNIYSGGVKG